MEPIVEARDIVFEYPGKRALDCVSFRIEPGTVTALVGPNGAGKTTLLRCLAALEQPFSGSVRVDGLDAGVNPRGCHKKLGFLGDFYGLYDRLSVRDCLRYIAATRGVSGRHIDELVEKTAEDLGILHLLEKNTSAMSRGQRQRVAIAQALVHGPKLLLLDEPAAGLDPEARHSLSKLIVRLRDGGISVIVSSHILSELDEYSSHMLTISHGRIVAHEELKPVSMGVTIRVKFAGSVLQALETAASIPHVINPRWDKEDMLLECPGDLDEQHEILSELMNYGLKVCSFSPETESIESRYLGHVSTAQKNSERIR